MLRLNLPSFQYKIKKEEGKTFIWDVIRKKFIVLTPEEWVRQHFVHYLTREFNYPRTLFRIEGSLHYNRQQKRSDILIRDRKGNPWLMVECKSPAAKLTQRAFNQVAVYNMTIGAKYLSVTNGMMHFCWNAGKPGQEPKFLNGFPDFE